MRRPRHLVVTLRAGEAPSHVPSRLDHLIGAARPVQRLDGGPVDAALRVGGGYRALGVYHAAAALGRAGEQAQGWNDVEQELGLARTYTVELADEAAEGRVLDALRSVGVVEAAAHDTFAVTPAAAVAPAPSRTLSESAWEPHDRVHAREAHELEPGDERVTVGLVDTGVSIGHPELQRKLLAGYDTVDIGLDESPGGMRLIGDSRGDDFTPTDYVGHGTHVAGIVGATGWELPPGLAGLSLLLPVRVLAASLPAGASRPVGVGALPDISSGLKIAIDLGARVLNLSFGTSESDVDPHGPLPHADVVAYAEHSGCILVAASGNSGRAERYYPAALPQVIAVGSVDSAGARSHFSTYGDHVALSAPGEHIVSSGLTGLREGSGTSYAAPFVTGAAALLVAHARRRDRELRSDDVRRLLVDSAAPLPGGRSPETGAGLLDAASALRRLDAEATP